MDNNVNEIINKIIGTKDSLLWSLMREFGYGLDDASIIKQQEIERKDAVLDLLKEAEDE